MAETSSSCFQDHGHAGHLFGWGWAACSVHWAPAFTRLYLELPMSVPACPPSRALLLHPARASSQAAREQARLSLQGTLARGAEGKASWDKWGELKIARAAGVPREGPPSPSSHAFLLHFHSGLPPDSLHPEAGHWGHLAESCHRLPVRPLVQAAMCKRPPGEVGGRSTCPRNPIRGGGA